MNRVLLALGKSSCSFLLLGLGLVCSLGAAPAVVINEIHYHPVEEAAFDANGAPVLDLSEDVHEFIELFNPGTNDVPLAGWQLSGGVSFDFATGAVIHAHGFVVVAKNPARLAAVTAYGLTLDQVLGPWSGKLGNSGDTVRLKNEQGDVIDSVSYSSAFPWAIGADALGADDEWTGLRSFDYQYRGRSLERVSAAWPGNDPANWLASPAPGNPSPGRSNAVSLVTPRPVVTSVAVYQSGDGEPIIRASQPVRIDCTFSGTNNLSNVSVEYFVDDINSTNEVRATAAMNPAGAPAEDRFTADLPGQPDRSIVRYRIRAERGAGMEAVSPRADDPLGWRAYFVSPLRSSTNRIYECFISAASLNTLGTNINQNPRRTTTPNPPGTPRASWNATEPAVFVFDGEVFDIRMRYHGSPFRRAVSRNSFKCQFPRYHPFDGRESAFITDKTSEYFIAGALYRAAGLPFSYVRWVDFYMNGNALLVRLEEDEMDATLFEKFAGEWHDANPELPREETGEWYKSQGTMIPGDPDGPYGAGTFYRMPARAPYWTELDRDEWTYALQMHGWKGHTALQSVIRDFWAARGDTNSSPNPNLSATRAFLEANFDVDATLTYLAIRNWSCGWDDVFQNYFAWHRANGRWAMLPWDVDNEIGARSATTSIFIGELGNASNMWPGPNWLKDSFFKAYRNEFKERLFLLNNTLMNPTNISAMGFTGSRSFADARFASVNSQLGLGVFQRPNRPVNLAPADGQAVLPPAILQASDYSHSASPAPAHAATTWFIRHRDGSYTAPVFKTPSASNLTSLAIPFDKLEFGETYYWKCIQTDVNGHPSLESAETSFVFGGQSVTLPLLAIDATTQWRYNQSGVSQPANWKSPGFDDSGWPQGAALLAAGVSGLPEPVRTTLAAAPDRLTFYFRATFNLSGDPASARLRLRHIVDDGAVFYLNGAEVLRTGMADGSVTASTTARRNVGNAVYEGPFSISAASLVQGTNVLAVEVHQFNSSSTDIAFGATLDALVPPTPGGVVLNEILADNQGAVTNGGTLPDYIELYNSTSLTQNLNGLSLSDNVLKPGKFIFPPGVAIAPHDFLIVWCDDQTNAPGLHAGFALDNDGQTVALFSVTSSGYTLADSVTFGLQAPDFSIGRVPAASGAWQLNAPTPKAANRTASLGAAASLKINEWMATDANGPDWLELFNPSTNVVALGGLSLTDDFADPSKSVLAPLSFIAAGGFRKFIADSTPAVSARHVDFKLSGTGEQIGLYDAALNAIDQITFGPQSAGVSQGRLPDGATNIVFFPTTSTPDDANYLPLTSIVINEVLAHSDPPLEDLIELFNPTGAAVDASGWWLSDSKAALRKFQLPTNSVISAGGYIVLYERQFNRTNSSTAFALNGARGDQVYLAAAGTNGNVTGFRAEAKFGPAENGVSHGRFATSQGMEFVALRTPTFGASNADARVGPIVVSEIMYHPPDLFDGRDDTREEFIELRNISTTNVALYDPAHPTNAWRLREAVDFVFPPGSVLGPGQTVLVVGFDPSDEAALNEFVDYFGSQVLHVAILGPFNGKLGNNSESVELVKPDMPLTEPGPDFGYVPSILVDKVHYADTAPWPASADGSGASLQRRVLAAYGNDPTNWFAAAPTPGGVNSSNALPAITLSVPAAAIVGPTNVLLAAAANAPDGYITKVEFFAGAAKLGEITSAPFNFPWNNAPLGAYALTARARDNLNAVAVSPSVSLQIVSSLTTVAVTAPPDGSLFQAGALVSITAVPSNTISVVTNVEFLVDGAKASADAAAPYTATWTALAGTHSLAAVGIDSLGLRATSAPVNVFVQAILNTNILLVVTNSTWKYLDNGTDQGTNWIALNFSDDTWSNGVAELGYGDTIPPDNKPETTVIGYGPDPNNRYITYYFRRKFVVDSLANVSNVTLRVLRDDGALAYINGVEVFRSNMPNGPINYRTLALSSAAGADEATFFPATVNPSLLVVGTNILAVEVHQVISNSVDMSFAASLEMARSALGPGILTQPQSRTELEGETVTFSVAAAGTAPLNYQWAFNNTSLPGATTPALVLADVELTNSGAYTVTISNAAGTVTSAPASLVVIGRPRVASSWDAASGRLTLSFPADPSRASIILASPDLQNWTPVATFAPGSGTIVWQDQTSRPARFYLVEQQ